ncbi:hypothetical protein G9A89_020330 [Geosiphon pyriformis]|nr:hypothetical protein G9A89_020330 [Geosiphon pyriformis]
MDTDRKAFEGKGVSDFKINTLQAKRFNNDAIIGSINYDMEEKEEVSLPFHKSFSLNKVWIDPKIIKTQMEIAVKKYFTLDINLLAVERKSATVKIQVIRKLFLRINDFGGATTPSKFKGIIRLTFTSSESMDKAALLARENNIIVNSNLKRQEIHSDRAVVIKKIPMDMPKDIIISFLIKKDSVHVAKAMRNRDIWAFRDCFKALLFTLLVGTTAHNLGNLLDNTGGKTCIINCLLDTGNRVYCAVVGFKFKNDLNSAFLTKPVFGGMHLSWARLDLVWCGKCGHLGHSALECNVSDMLPSGLLSSFNRKHAPGVDHLQLAKLYAKKNVSISCPAAFGGKSWTQVVSLAFSSGGSPSGSVTGIGFSSLETLGLGDSSPSSTINNSSLNTRLASLKCSFELLAEQVFGIVRKLSFVELVPKVSSAGVPLLVGSVPLVYVLDSDMALNGELALSTPHPLSTVLGTGFSLSSLKVLTTKMGGLGSKMLLLLILFWLGINVSAKQVDVLHWHVKSGLMVSFVTETKLRSSISPWIKNKFDGVCIFTSDLDIGFLSAGVAIIMNNSLARHVSKVEEVPGQIIAVWLLFRNKLSVSVIGLYAGASSGVCFGQASEMNSLIAKAVNSSIFVVLGGDFNENRSGRSASFKFCSGLDLVNSFGVKWTIDFIFVSGNLVSAVAGHRIGSVLDFFDTNHNAVMVSVGLGELLDVHLNSLYKQTNKNFMNFFFEAEAGGNLDAMWAILERGIVESADKVFVRHWFSEFQCSRNKHSSKFFGLELFIAKIVSKIGSGDMLGVDCLVRKWFTLDKTKTSAFSDLVILSGDSIVFLEHLSSVHKKYRRSKMFESRLAEEISIKKATEKHMESFASNKGGMIQSVLDWPFCKVVLDHLVVNDELVLEPEEVKFKYMPLDYIRDDAFSGVIRKVDMEELLLVVGGLPNGKAAGLSGIPNKLWKHDGKVVLSCLLVLLNACLSIDGVPVSWKKAWVLMIPKPYDWDSVLTNTHPIALIETARKILSKVLFNWISFTYSKFSVLRGDNFLVLKGTFMQSLVFAIGAVVENALKKNRELWLDSSELSSYFMAGAFVDDTIWVGNCQATIQNILDIVSEFFVINDISINNKKTVAIPINRGVKIVSLSINGLPILIAKKDEVHHYLGIFLSTKGLLKLSVAKMHSNQVQSKGKLAVLISFSNSFGVLGHLFEHRFLDLQVLEWSPLNPLQFPVGLHVSLVNNFLAGMVKIFLCNKLSLTGASLASSVESTCLSGMSILDSEEFSAVVSGLHEVWSDSFEVFTNGSLKNFGEADVANGAAAFFPAIDMSIGIKVHGLLSSTMAKLQAIALSLECVPSFCTIVMHTDSQAAINACISEMLLSVPDFCSSCWLERCQIFDLVHEKDLSVHWIKVKRHSGVVGNVKANAAAGEAVFSHLSLPVSVWKCFLVAENTPVSDNTCHFVQDLYRSVCHARWEAGPGQDVISDVLVEDMDWNATVRVWHPDSYMLAGFTS